jgi:hypothetical protein
VLFIGREAAAWNREAPEAPCPGVLMVGESEGFLAGGGMVRLEVVDGRIRFEIAAPVAARAGLVISAQLLRLARPPAASGASR